MMYRTKDGRMVVMSRNDPLYVEGDEPDVIVKERNGYVVVGFFGAIVGAIVAIAVLAWLGYVRPVETASIVEPAIPVVAHETSMPLLCIEGIERRDLSCKTLGSGAVEATNGNLERRSTSLSMSSGIGTSLEGVRGTATWYDNGPGLYAAAGPGLRIGHWRGRVVSVCDPAACVTVRLTDWCACPHHLIDLSPSAFSSLAPLSRGVVGVVVSWGSPALPATDR